MTSAPSRPTGPPVPTDRTLPAPPFPLRPARRTPAATFRRIGRRAWPWLVAVAVVVLVVAAELALLKDRIGEDVARLRAAGGQPATSVASPPGGLPPVPTQAPPAAGAVRAVRLRTLGPPCTPGRACGLVVRVDRVPPGPTAWSFVVVDRCAGTVTTARGATTPGTPGALGIATVVLPGAPALLVIAVTDTPARAASVPLTVGSGRC
jgi:hypothetical protein